MFRLWLVCFFVIIGCTGRRNPAPNELIVAIAAEPATLDPRYATDANGMRISSLIFNGLVRIGDNFQPLPEAALKWVQKGSSFRFYLDPDLRFHNGRPVGVEDVEFSFAQFLNPKSPFASSIQGIKKVGVSQKNGQIQVDIDFQGTVDRFMLSELPAIRLLPKKEMESLGDDFRKHLIGTGPFRFAGTDFNEIRLQAVTAKTPKLTFKIVRDDQTRFQKIIKGEVDVAQAELPPEKIQQIVKLNKGLTVIAYPGLTTTYILINFKDPLLAQKGVRQALAQAINRSELIEHKMFRMAQEATSILTPNNPYFLEGLKNPPFDPLASESLITNLNHTGRSLTLKTSNSPLAIENGRVLAHQMSASGLRINLQSFEWGTFYDDVKKGNFQLATMRWVGTVDPDLYRLAFHSKETPPGRNRGSFANPNLDRLLDQTTTVKDFKSRQSLFNQIQKIVHEDLAIIPLWYDQQVTVLRPAVKGYKPSPSSDFWPLVEVYKN